MPSDMDTSSDARSAESKSLRQSSNPAPNLSSSEEPDLLHRMELKDSLRELRITATSTTARLDNTYYSVLEKFSTLQNSVAAIQELCNTAQKLNSAFLQHSEAVTKEAEEQLETLEDLGSQKESIDSLQSRISDGRKKVERLSERLDVVRNRAEAWSKGEAGWEEKTRRRIRLFWGLSAAFVLVVVGLLVFQYIPARQVQVGGLGIGMRGEGRNGTMTEKEVMADLSELTRKSVVEMEREEGVLEELRRGVGDGDVGGDERLRVFDEL